MKKQKGVMATTGLSMTEGTVAQVEEQNEYNSLQNAYDLFHQGQEQASEVRYQGEIQKRNLLYQADMKDYEAQMAQYSFDNSLAGMMTNLGDKAWNWYTMGLG